MTSEQRLTGLLDMASTAQQLELNLGKYPEYADWKGHSRRMGGSLLRAVFIRIGPRDVKAVQRMAKRCGLHGIIAFNTEKAGYGMLLRTDEKSRVFPLVSDAACDHMYAVFRQTEFGSTELKAEMAIEDIMDTASITTEHFINRGVFSNHYLENRLLAELEQTIGDKAEAMRPGNVKDMVRALGWSQNANRTDSGSVHVVVSEEPDLGMARGSGRVAPSYEAVTRLADHAWVILTNGRSWRLYTDRVSASTTTYFEINLKSKPDHNQLLYLAGIFGRDSYEGASPLIIKTYDESQKYSRKLEDDLANELLRGGVFLNIVKGLLHHDMTTPYTDGQLDHAKSVALKILYRILFVLYAEARDLLPVSDARYREISIDTLRNKLESLESDGDGDGCWRHLLRIFAGISDGDAEHNLPQYNGDLFAHNSQIDGAQVRNMFIIPALRGLLERNGESIDYAALDVRHLGSIYERLLEFSVNQAEADILVREDSKGVHIVESKEHFKYKKNDLYLASKDGMVGRKTTASYYTPRQIVQFLVKRGLGGMLREREASLPADIKKYRRSPSEELRKKCVDHIMGIQVLDPAMGSGHFLVEALNQITTWATGILTKYPDHPIWDDIRHDRDTILHEQESQGVRIDPNLLTADALLKRRIMKKCIFGVDVNPLATELARVSLWLDSFAIGTPLTYMGHHIKCGDSTIGMWLDDANNQDRSLDDFGEDTTTANHIRNVSASPDITMEQVRLSQNECAAHEDKVRPHKNRYDALAAHLMDPETTPKQAGVISRTVADRWDGKSDSGADAVKFTKRLSDRHRFFHWELEMTDAFTDGRNGFDLIVGNFPWDVVIPNDDEFFERFDQKFKSLKPNSRKEKRKQEILKQKPHLKKTYDSYLEKVAQMKLFYSRMYEMQGSGNKDLWQLVMERCYDLCVPDTGVISVLVPSVLLNNGGCTCMRRHMLDKNHITSLYVFENKEGIFSNVDSRYRFALLTVRNGGRTGQFPAGFFLHDMASLKDNSLEAAKFGTVTAQDIRDSTPEQYIVPELMGSTGLEIYQRLHKLKQTLVAGHNGWNIALSTGFNTTTNSKLLNTRQSAGFRYWPVIKGECIHHFMPDFRPPPYVADKTRGLAAERKKRVYGDRVEAVYGMCRLAFRNQASDTNARTVIAAIIPPNTFSLHSMSFLVLSRHGRTELEGGELDSYHREISYLAAVLNSTTFDYLVRAKTLANTPIYVRTTPLPDQSTHDDTMIRLAARLSVNGKPEFKQFAKSMGIPNILPTPEERIKVTAQLDALAAHAYGLDKTEYQTVLDSFKFKEDPSMIEMETVDWQASRARPMSQYFGEVRKRAMDYLVEVGA